MLLQLESQATPQGEVVLNGFLQSFHRAPPGQGSAKVRNAVKSTLAYTAVVFGLRWRSSSPISSRDAPSRKQIGRQCVAEEMGAFAGRIDASADQRPPDDRGDCDGIRETTKRSSMSEKHMTADTARTARAQVDCDGFTNVGRQRQLCPASTLAPNGDPAVVPIDVIQAQRNDLAGTQAQSGEQQ